MSPTTFEDHQVYCDHCQRDLGPCAEYGCVCRYAHGGGVCGECEKKEQGNEEA